MSQRVAELEQERDDLRADLHDTESRLRDALTLARNYGMQAEEQGRWWREAKAQLQAAEQERDTSAAVNARILLELKATEQRCAALEGALRAVLECCDDACDQACEPARALLAPASPAPAMTEADYGLRPGPWVCPTCGDPECG